MDTIAGMFMSDGVSSSLTHDVMHVLGHRIWGFTPEAFEDPDPLPIPEDPALKRQAMEEVRAVYPHIYAITIATMGPDLSGPGCDAQVEYEFALDLILGAIERIQSRYELSDHPD